MMAKRFDPGHLRHALVLQEATYEPDPDGGHDTVWTDVATMWGALKPLRTDTLLRAGAPEVDVTHLITVRHGETILPNMRFSMGDRAFTVLTVTDLDETGRYTVATTREEPA